jgi:hypothetical protein
MRPILFLLLTHGCAESLRPAEREPDAGRIADAPIGSDAITPTGKVTTVPRSDGTATTLVDAESMTDWIHVDFATGAEVPATGTWQLRFQRFHISTNAGVEVAPIEQRFAEVTSAPASGWVTDADVDGDQVIDYALDQGAGWYDYDATTHVLTPKPLVWVIRTGTGARFKLQLHDYYDSAGTSGWLTFHWGTL